MNVTETDFRHYDSALGRFNVMDALSELAYDHTPYRYGFNNPVFFSDASGLFESWGPAREYQLSNGLFESTIDYDGDNDYWFIIDGGSTISQLGNKILKTYEIDGEWILDISDVGGSGGNGNSQSKKSDGGFWKFMETGGWINIWGRMKDDPGFKPNSRKRGTVELSMNYDEVYERGAGSIRKGANFWKRLKEAFGGADSRSSTLSERLNKTEAKDKETEAKETFYYDTYGITPHTWENKFILVPTKRSVHMTPTEFKNMDVSAKKVIDSIQAAEAVKTNDISKYNK